MILNYCNLCNYETISLKSNQHSLDIKSVYIKYSLKAVVVKMNEMVTETNILWKSLCILFIR